MKRAEVLAAIKAAGATGDAQAFARLYVEHRIRYAVALAAYREGAAFARFVNARRQSGDESKVSIT
jgi:hypothetical protein